MAAAAAGAPSKAVRMAAVGKREQQRLVLAALRSDTSESTPLLFLLPPSPCFQQQHPGCVPGTGCRSNPVHLEVRETQRIRTTLVVESECGDAARERQRVPNPGRVEYAAGCVRRGVGAAFDGGTAHASFEKSGKK